MSTLFRITEQAQARCEERKKVLSLSEIRTIAKQSRTPIDFASIFEVRTNQVRVIAEVKLASPTEGEIAPKANPVVIARDYLKSGAVALSVLTEEDHFKGSQDYLSSIRRDQPASALLMKDFVTDEYQVYEARAAGADAILLIVALLNDSKLKMLHEKALDIGLTPFVEVHDPLELKRASELPLQLLGINNRDLKTMKVSLNTSLELSRAVKDLGIRAPMISESGIKSAADLLSLQSAGFSGFLIGSSLMKTGSPGKSLSELLEKTRSGVDL